MTSRDQDLQIIDEALKILGEQFDSVQILCTRYESTEGGTINVQKGTGCWFSRFGLAKKFVLKCEEELRLEVSSNEG